MSSHIQLEKSVTEVYFHCKQVGLSRAYYRNERVCEESMPTDRSKAALRFLLANNAFYKVPAL